jgi:hypothetical protein
MMMTKIEHVNITVPDIDAAVAFLKIVAPDFEIRNDEKPLNDKRWMHIGNNRKRTANYILNKSIISRRFVFHNQHYTYARIRNRTHLLLPHYSSRYAQRV